MSPLDFEYQVRVRLLFISSTVRRSTRSAKDASRFLLKGQSRIIPKLNSSLKRLSASTARLEECLQRHGI